MTFDTESAVQDVRAEWVSSDTSGAVARPPTDPSWNRFGDFLASYPDWDPTLNTAGFTPVGSGDRRFTFRGSEEHDLAIQWLMQRHFLDGSGNANDPIGQALDHAYASEPPINEVLLRRESEYGGNKGAGYRELIYASGCRIESAAIPGDPSSGEPIVLEAGMAAEKVRDYVVHQPASSVTPEVASTSSEDTTQTVTIETADGSTSVSATLSGTTPQPTGSISDIEAIWVDDEHVGDITVTDGNSNTLLETPLLGQNSLNTSTGSDRGIPLLGAGSHASAIGTDPEQYQFQNTAATWDGNDLAQSTQEDRLSMLDLEVSYDISREPRQGWKRQIIDVGPREVTASPETSGPYETGAQLHDFFAGTQADLVYTFPDGTVTLRNAQPESVDSVDRANGDINDLRSWTLAGNKDSSNPAVTVSNSS